MNSMTIEVRVAGIVDKTTLDELGDVNAAVEGTTTVLSDTATDEAALDGLLARLRDRGLHLIEVRRLHTA
jgi:hypothetical protein